MSYDNFQNVGKCHNKFNNIKMAEWTINLIYIYLKLTFYELEIIIIHDKNEVKWIKSTTTKNDSEKNAQRIYLQWLSFKSPVRMQIAIQSAYVRCIFLLFFVFFFFNNVNANWVWQHCGHPSCPITPPA